MFAVWFAVIKGVAQFRKLEWKYKIFDSEDDAWDWYREYRKLTPYDELDTVEPPVPFVDGRPQEPEYIDKGCKGQLSMFD